MHLPKLITAVVVFMLICGCTTTETSRIITPETAALADTVTTQIVLNQGGREANPLGASGVLVGKVLYLFVVRPELSDKERTSGDRLATSVWMGAAVNNIVQLVFPFTPLVGIAAGVIVGREIYQRY